MRDLVPRCPSRSWFCWPRVNQPRPPHFCCIDAQHTLLRLQLYTTSTRTQGSLVCLGRGLQGMASLLFACVCYSDHKEVYRALTNSPHVRMKHLLAPLLRVWSERFGLYALSPPPQRLKPGRRTPVPARSPRRALLPAAAGSCTTARTSASSTCTRTSPRCSSPLVGHLVLLAAPSVHRHKSFVNF